ncbi:MAG: hypothetical protein KDC00_10605 [Flavobacteriales bacterium]|nr:hypothetical protein [Flavobacteriales bacterium]
MELRISRVHSTVELRRYIHLPAELPGKRSNYVPPIWKDEHVFHDPQRNLELNSCRTVRFMAYQDDRAVGRVMGIVHERHNELHKELSARFYQLDCIEDPSVAAALLGSVETWARELGMDRIIGPFGLSDKDPQGVQVEGFEHLPVIATATNPAYLPGLIELQGYAKFTDAVVYRVDVPAVLPELYTRVSERLLTGGRFRLLSFTSRRQLKPWVIPVLRLVNETYQDLLGFVTMDESAMRKLADQYLPVLDPKLVKIVIDEQLHVVAFVVAMPDMSAGIVKANGRLFPLGWWHILQAMKRTDQLDLFLGAVRKDVQGRGFTCALGVYLMAAARERGLTHIDSHLVLETNHRMRAELDRLGGKVWKRYRIYSKAL